MEILIASFNEFNIIHNGSSLCCQSCDHKGRSCTQIRSADAGSGITGNAVNDRRVSFYLDIGPHTGKLIYIFKTIFKNTFCYNTGSPGKSQRHRDLWLHIRRKSRIGKGLYMGMGQGLGSYHAHSVIRFLHLTPDFCQFGADGFQMLGDHVFDGHIPLGHCSCKHKGSCFDLIRNDRIFRAMQLGNTFDPDHICSRSLNGGAHTVQEIGHIHYMRLLCCIFNDRLSFRHSCCQHDINGCTYRYHVHINMAAAKVLCFCYNQSMLNPHIRSQCPKALDVLVDGS